MTFQKQKVQERKDINLICQHWVIVEKKIVKEMIWLRRVISTFRDKEYAAGIGCRECFIKKIAIFIVSGEIKAKAITKSSGLKNFWINKKMKGFNPTFTRSQIKTKQTRNKQHGSDWHQEMMDKIENHFLQLGYKIIREPDMCHGRADLGVYKKNEPPLMIEIGTTSFFKLWKNLIATSDKFIYLIVPNDDILIEFKREKRYPIRSKLYNYMD